MVRPLGRNLPISVMIKSSPEMKARLTALAERTPFDVSIGFSVVARRAIAIGLEVLERDPRLIVEPLEGDAAAALAVLSGSPPFAKITARTAQIRAGQLAADGEDDITMAAVQAVAELLGEP